jgi:signal transduction histidine kinase
LADADRLRKLVQDFLTLSRLESGRVDWNLEPLQLQECVDLALSSIRARRSNDAAPIQIAAQVPEDLPLVQADGEWLVEVLAKLLDNACKFTQPPGLVTVQAKRTGSQVEVLVADTGRGITPERLDVVFDRFYQEEGALRRTQGGTGLGLAICRQIVNSWGGKIWATSAGKDQGSQFHFTVPVAVVSGETGPQSPPGGGRNRGGGGSGRRRATLR